MTEITDLQVYASEVSLSVQKGLNAMIRPFILLLLYASLISVATGQTNPRDDSLSAGWHDLDQVGTLSGSYLIQPMYLHFTGMKFDLKTGRMTFSLPVDSVAKLFAVYVADNYSVYVDSLKKEIVRLKKRMKP